MTINCGKEWEEKQRKWREELSREKNYKIEQERDKLLQENKEYKKETNSFSYSAPIIGFILFALSWTNFNQCSSRRELYNKLEKINPKNAHIEYINNDSLPDLIYKTGEIYIQTQEGNFVSYKKLLHDESKYKTDSLKKVYENKLEKSEIK